MNSRAPHFNIPNAQIGKYPVKTRLVSHQEHTAIIFAAMNLSPLSAISPIDGRYRPQLEKLAPFFSEAALIQYRVRVEVEYLLMLAEEGIIEWPAAVKVDDLRALYTGFSEEDAQAVKDIERTTNHDVKAVEYFLKEKIKALGGESLTEWIHFGLTSQDINNTATPLLWKEALEAEYYPMLTSLIDVLRAQAQEWKGIPMLARTHGQPASPTTLGKEWMVFVDRLDGQMSALKGIPHKSKFSGATGNFNAHYSAFPQHDWLRFGFRFTEEKLGLKYSRFTTQIVAYDGLAAQLDAMKRINTILTDLSRDVWTYIMLEYFRQQTKAGEIGSSAMPHKVNPIDFENGEGNLGLANALLEHLSAKLPISRLQRDLTDSTVLRNLGMPFAHSYLAMISLKKGLGKLLLNREKLDSDLEANWAVVAEGIQTILRREKYPNPYEALKDLTRGRQGINKESLHHFIDGLNVTAAVTAELKALTPQTYIGIPFDY